LRDELYIWLAFVIQCGRFNAEYVRSVLL